MYSRQGSLGANCSFSILMVIFFIIFILTLNGFQARRSFGIFLIIMYFVFILQCMLSEVEILHGFGTDHENEMKAAE